MQKDNTNPEESEAQIPAEQEEEQKDDTGSQTSGDDSNEESTDEGESSESEAEVRARKLEEERNNIKNELISMREERRELRNKIQEMTQNSNNQEVYQGTDENQQDVTKVVESLLQQREQERAKENRRKAFEKFIRENKMYHPENDTSGLMRERLENEVSQFNLSGVVETEDFYEYINKANRLIAPQSSQVKKTVNPYPTDPSSSGNTAQVSETDSLSKKEKDLARRAGWSEDKLKALKKTDPEYFQELMM